MPRLGLGVGLGASTAMGGGGASVTYLPELATPRGAVYSPFKMVAEHTGPTILACATSAPNTPVTTIAINTDASGFPDYTEATAAFGAVFDCYQRYDQSGNGHHDITPTASKRRKIQPANKWGAFQALTSYPAGGYSIFPDTLVTSRQAVSLVTLSAQRGMQGGNRVIGLNNTGSTATLLDMSSDNAGVDAIGNAFIRGLRLGLVTPTIKAICVGASNTKIHRNDDLNTLGALTASVGMLGGASGATKTGATTVSSTGQSALEDNFLDIVYQGQVSDADMVTLKAALKARFPVIRVGSIQIIHFSDSIGWGQGSISGINYPSQLLQYLPDTVEFSNPSTPGKTLNTLITDATSFIVPRIETGKTKRLVLCSAGTNDLYAASPADAATTLDRQRQVAQPLVTATALPVFYTIPDRRDALYTSAKNTERLAYNAALLDAGRRATYGYEVIDRASNPDLADANNTMFFNADKLHFTDAGYQSAAAYEQAALNAILAAA